MLVLSRRKDESIIIGDEIEIIIVDVRGDKVRLGINAPDMPVHRKEIFLKILEEVVTEILCKKEQKGDGLLVLSRQRDESIVIGKSIDILENIEITIVDVRGDKVRLGINAPREISVHRKEIYKAIQREKAQQQDAGESAGQTREEDN